MAEFMVVDIESVPPAGTFEKAAVWHVSAASAIAAADQVAGIMRLGASRRWFVVDAANVVRHVTTPGAYTSSTVAG